MKFISYRMYWEGPHTVFWKILIQFGSWDCLKRYILIHICRLHSGSKDWIEKSQSLCVVVVERASNGLVVVSGSKLFFIDYALLGVLQDPTVAPRHDTPVCR